MIRRNKVKERNGHKSKNKFSDIEIARKVKLKPIEKIAEKLKIKGEELEVFGKYKAKLATTLWERIKERPNGKLILVTAINPTPAGEGKTTVSIGLAMAMNRLGKKAILSLREPSLGPCMGMKGGATGGGKAQILPMEEINLHFTGDLHAIAAANNLLAAMIDNHIYYGNKLKIDLGKIIWKRTIDLNDRALRKITVNFSRKKQTLKRLDGFNITAASEVMAIVCLSRDLNDLKKRLGEIVVAYNQQDQPIKARDLKAVGAMATLLKDALKPNLVQTSEGTPALVHGGPFANIAHGCSSLLATRYGLKLADYVVTEAGFGADLGAEKFFNIKCRIGKITPAAAVLVVTVRSLKYNGGQKIKDLKREDLKALQKGLANLKKHLENLEKFNLPVVVAINAFATDTLAEIKLVKQVTKKLGHKVSVVKVWERGGGGAKELAQRTLEAIDESKTKFRVLYDLEKSLKEKINQLTREIYGAKKVNYSVLAKRQLALLEKNNYGKLPVCVAKTQYSFSDKPELLGSPTDFEMTVSEIRLSAGAGFIVVIFGEIMTMPGLPKAPAAEKINIDKNNKIKGLF